MGFYLPCLLEQFKFKHGFVKHLGNLMNLFSIIFLPPKYPINKMCPKLDFIMALWPAEIK